MDDHADILSLLLLDILNPAYYQQPDSFIVALFVVKVEGSAKFAEWMGA